MIQKLQSGADFVELAKANSQDTTNNTNAGILPAFAKGEMVEPFEQAAWKLEPGQITSEPVKTQFGWHIIKRGKTIPAGLEPFESAKTKFAERLKQQKQNEAVQDWLKQKRTAAQIVFQPDYQPESAEITQSPSPVAETEASASPSVSASE